MVPLWERAGDSYPDVDRKNGGDVVKLYERNEPLERLVEAFERRQLPSLPFSTGELILITGPSGTGKTTLAQAFRSHAERNLKGIWIEGKFDQIHREQPYAAFLYAVEDLVKKLGVLDCESKRDLEDLISARIDLFDRQWLASAVPSLGKILSVANEALMPSTSSGRAVLNSGAVARNQFRRIVPSLLSAVGASLKAPIILFLDDLQWSDLASLELLRDLACNNMNSSFMVVGACRGNEVGFDDPLSVMLRRLEDKDNVKIANIAISNLTLCAVQEFVADALQLPVPVIQSLADIVYRESEGNVFYMIRFLQTLKDSGFLYRDSKSQQWKWDEEQIRPRFNDVLQLLSAAIVKLPEHVQQVLQVAACLGTKFKEQHLQMVISSEIEPALASAEEMNIVAVDEDIGECSWVHDRWQQAAYQRIPEDTRPQFHLQIGRMLWNGLTSEKDVDENLYLIVNQLVKGAHLITDEEERQSAAILCLQAGEKAGRSSAFQIAATYFDHGMNLLSSRHWRDQYELSLSLFNGAAEMAYCNNRFTTVKMLADEVKANARSVLDQLPSSTAQIYALGTDGNLTDAIEAGLTLLKQLGIVIPRNTKMWHVALEFTKVKQALRGKSDSDILSLPALTDASKAAAMNLMNLLYLFAKVVRWNLCAVIALRTVRMTLEDGLAGASSAPCFSFYGIILCWLGDVDEGHRCSRLSLMLLDKFYVKEWIPRVSSVAFGIVLPWKTPLRECAQGLRDSHRIALEFGDHEISARCASIYSIAHFLSGQPLGVLMPQLEAFSSQLKTFTHNDQETYITSFSKILCTFTDKESSRSCSDLPRNVENTEKHDSNVLAKVSCMTMITLCLQNKHDFANQLASRYGPPPKMGPPFLTVGYYTYYALACLALSNSHAASKMRTVRSCLKVLHKFADHCPENVDNKILLLEAEIARLRGNEEVAQLKYDESINLAEREGNLMETALACERAGLFFREIGSPADALAYFERAQSLYLEWGSPVLMEKVKDIAETERLRLKSLI